MKTKTVVLILILILILVFTLILVSRSPYTDVPVPKLESEIGSIPPSINEQIQVLHEESGIPSLAVSIVVGDELIWARGYGNQSDLSTAYVTGSIDKTFITTAILQLNEKGLIDLEDDVNEYLPFSVRHPDYPDIPITIRMLLTHKSGLSHDFPGTRYIDNDGPMLRWTFRNNGYQFSDLYHSFFPLSQNKYLDDLFSKWKYGSDFWMSKPDTQYQYSNSAYYLLLNTIIEDVTTQSYDVYIRKNILEPLGMDNTSFEAYDYPKEQLAIPYEDFGESNSSALPLTGMSASGRMRTNVIDLSKYLLVHMNQGELIDTLILQPASVEMMHDRIITLGGTDFPPMDLYGLGLSWFLWKDGYQGHPGASPGYIAQIIYKESDNVPYGIVIMMTYGCSKTECDFTWFNDYYVTLRELLLEEAERIAIEQVE